MVCLDIIILVCFVLIDMPVFIARSFVVKPKGKTTNLLIVVMMKSINTAGMQFVWTVTGFL
jgi:hypothetical protein